MLCVQLPGSSGDSPLAYRNFSCSWSGESTSENCIVVARVGAVDVSEDFPAVLGLRGASVGRNEGSSSADHAAIDAWCYMYTKNRLL